MASSTGGTHQFRAPGAGWYEFKSALSISGARKGDQVVLCLFVNDVRTADLSAAARGENGSLKKLGPSGGDNLYLRTGDTVDVRVLAVGAGMTVDGGIHSSFTGRRLPGL
jgi:hypothetical protein